MKTPITLGAAMLVILTLTGCATQAQIEEQNKQLADISVSLNKLQAFQPPAEVSRPGKQAIVDSSRTYSTVVVYGVAVDLTEDKLIDGDTTIICRKYLARVKQEPSQEGTTTSFSLGETCLRRG
jgi:outer membrane murein-binding lipoprotein Lpp